MVFTLLMPVSLVHAAASCRNQILLRLIFWSHDYIQSAVSLSFHSGLFTECLNPKFSALYAIKNVTDYHSITIHEVALGGDLLVF
jgi:hypothetical protein